MSRKQILAEKGQLRGLPSGLYLNPSPPPLAPKTVQDKPKSDEWKDWAACREAPPDIFYPPLNDEGVEEWAIGADVQPKKFCAVCPVRKHCLAAGLYEPYGIWGSKTASERRVFRRNNRLPTMEDVQPRHMPRHGTKQRALSGCMCAKCIKVD